MYHVVKHFLRYFVQRDYAQNHHFNADFDNLANLSVDNVLKKPRNNAINNIHNKAINSIVNHNSHLALSAQLPASIMSIFLQNFPLHHKRLNSNIDTPAMRLMHLIHLRLLSPWLTAAIVASITLLPKAADAHGAKLELQPVQAFEIQANYDSGDPMPGAQVQVFAPDQPQTAVLVGQTDKNGRWLWQPDRPGEWTIQVRQAGHGDIAHITVTEADLLTVNRANSANSATASASNSSAQTSVDVAPVSGESQAQGRVETEEDSLQRLVSIALVVWGAIGTALFFSRQSNEPPNNPQSDI